MTTYKNLVSDLEERISFGTNLVKFNGQFVDADEMLQDLTYNSNIVEIAGNYYTIEFHKFKVSEYLAKHGIEKTIALLQTEKFQDHLAINLEIISELQLTEETTEETTESNIMTNFKLTVGEVTATELKAMIEKNPNRVIRTMTFEETTEGNHATNKRIEFNSLCRELGKKEALLVWFGFQQTEAEETTEETTETYNKVEAIKEDANKAFNKIVKDQNANNEVEAIQDALIQHEAFVFENSSCQTSPERDQLLKLALFVFVGHKTIEEIKEERLYNRAFGINQPTKNELQIINAGKQHDENLRNALLFNSLEGMKNLAAFDLHLRKEIESFENEAFPIYKDKIENALNKAFLKVCQLETPPEYTSIKYSFEWNECNSLLGSPDITGVIKYKNYNISVIQVGEKEIISAWRNLKPKRFSFATLQEAKNAIDINVLNSVAGISPKTDLTLSNFRDYEALINELKHETCNEIQYLKYLKVWQQAFCSLDHSQIILLKESELLTY